ncbi:hypothetical protein [Deinococcus budaensis]|uniref:Lipoprotein n=1 Tax=Deinococcus budaensis TaxID=1665626 RepID=A0A7W8GE51_9DEIO|nr:hypothetical protein [Deinococcus budaensis]MBB5233699.1 hypothetical protein [Deinococcus budaensis]
MWRVFPLLLPALLSGCQDREARAETARLAARVAALEAQVQALGDAGSGAVSGSRPDEVVMRAAGQHCANDLDRVLETHRQDAGSYPAARDVRLPESCLDLRVGWRDLKPQSYAFSVADLEGRPLAQGRGP